MKYKSNGNPGLCVHNPETNKLLCQFIGGEFETDNKKAIKILDNVAAGPNPELSRADGKETKVSELNHAPTALVDMSVKNLKEYAKDHGVQLPKSAKSKVDVIAVIEEALQEEADELAADLSEEEAE